MLTAIKILLILIVVTIMALKYSLHLKYRRNFGFRYYLYSFFRFYSSMDFTIRNENPKDIRYMKLTNTLNWLCWIVVIAIIIINQYELNVEATPTFN